MLLTRASEYAILSLIVISKESEPQDAESLATKLELSKSFLAKILQNLAKGGVLKSFKGAKGGFALDKAPSDITLIQIIDIAEGKHPKVFTCSSEKSDCMRDPSFICALQPFLGRLQVKIDDFLQHITLQDLLTEEK